MAIQELGVIAAFLAAIAVVVSLLYLAKEVRQNSRGLALTQELTGAQITNANCLAIATDPEFAGLYRRALADFDCLDADEKFRAGQFLMGVFYGFQSAHYGYMVARTADKTTWVGHRALLGSLLHTPGAKSWWEGHRALFAPAFRDYVDGALLEAKASSDDKNH